MKFKLAVYLTMAAITAGAIVRYAHREAQPPSLDVPGAHGRPEATAKPAGGYLWEVGARSVHQAHMTWNAKLGARSTLRGLADTRVTRTVLSLTENAARELITIELIAVRSERNLDGQAETEDLAGEKAEVIMADVLRELNGQLRQIDLVGDKVRPEDPFVRFYLLGNQLISPAGGIGTSERWEAEQTNGTDSYRGSYVRITDGAPIQVRKTAEYPMFGEGILGLNSRGLVKYSADFSFDPAAGQIDGFKARETRVALKGGDEIVRSEMELSVELQSRVRLPEIETATLRAELDSAKSGRQRIPLVQTEQGLRDRRLGEALGEQKSSEVWSQFSKAMRSGAGRDLANATLQIEAVLRLRPGDSNFVAMQLAGLAPLDPKGVRVLSLLTEVGTPEAQIAMRTLAEERLKIGGRVPDVLTAIAFVERPTRESEEFLRTLATRGDSAKEVVQAAELGLGVMARHLSADPARSAAIVAPYLEKLKGESPPPSEVVKAMALLGNAGSPTSFEATVKYLNHENENVRAASVMALRNIETPQAETALFGVLAGEASTAVRMAAARALTMRALKPESAGALSAAVAKEEDPAIKSRLVAILDGFRSDSASRGAASE